MSTETDGGGFAPPPSLRDHVRSSLLFALTHRIAPPTPPSDQEAAELVAERITRSLLGNVTSNRQFFDQGTFIAKAIKPYCTGSTVRDLLSGAMSIEAMLEEYSRHVERNNAVFSTIQKVHQDLQKNTSTTQHSLQQYADAASFMGSKKWVAESNEWMANFSVSFFRRNGARRSFLKDLPGAAQSEENPSLLLLQRDLQLDSTSPGAPLRAIRVLDVGSCYNPLAKSPLASAFDVTAVDLCPADPSVIPCDFLKLKVGEEGSVPIYSEDGALVQLPARSFDVVTMSLVLSYLPRPSQRLAMVDKAKQLLKLPPLPSADRTRVHDCGLLLIVEKESIFALRKASRANASAALARSAGSGSGSGSRQNEVPGEGDDLCGQWKNAIVSQGLRLVKYSNLLLAREGGRRVHAFAFKTFAAEYGHGLGTSAGAAREADAGGGGDQGKGKAEHGLWIAQDFLTDAETASLGKKAVSDIPSVRPTSTSSSSRPRPPLAIVGGGLGGAALALALHRRGLPFAVYEADSSFAARKQGYALTMQQGTTALKALGISEAAAASGVPSLAHVSYDARGRVLGAYGAGARAAAAATAAALSDSTAALQPSLQPSRARHNLHIPRQSLRRLFLDALFSPQAEEGGETRLVTQTNSPGTNSDGSSSSLGHPATPTRSAWHWGKRLSGVHPVVCGGGDSQNQPSWLELSFSDGSTATVSALVAADGIHSRVRHLCAPASGPLRPLGLMVVLGICPLAALGDPKTETAGLDPACTQRQWLDGSTRVFSMPFGDSSSVMWQLSFPLEEGTQDRTQQGPEDGTRLKTLALKRCGDWHEPLARMIRSTDSSMVSGHPVFDRDPPQPGWGLAADSLVTMLGDAAHPMSPFKGQGANQALLDATALARAIAGSDYARPGRRALHEAFRSYETSMCERSGTKVKQSRLSAEFLHSPAALNPMNVTRAAAAEIAFRESSSVSGATAK